MRAMVAHFEATGDIPLLAVFDRPKTIAIAWSKDGVVTERNATFAGVVLDLGLGGGAVLAAQREPERLG